MTRAEMLEVVYRFYPRGLIEGADGYDDTEERQHQRDAARRGVAEFPTWKAMTRRLGARYPLIDRSLSLLAGSWDPAYSADLEIPGRTLGFHVSLLGPYYGIHRTGLPVEELPAGDLAREIEATYPGYEPIPPEIGDEVVPDVCPFGRATLYHCLLSTVWEDSSGPWPPPSRVPVSAAEQAARRLERRNRCKSLVKQGFRWGRLLGLAEREALAFLDEHEAYESDREPVDEPTDPNGEKGSGDEGGGGD